MYTLQETKKGTPVLVFNDVEGGVNLILNLLDNVPEDEVEEGHVELFSLLRPYSMDVFDFDELDHSPLE